MDFKKLAAIILALCLTICLLPATYTHASEEAGYFTYEVTDGKATITACDTSISGDITIPATLGGYPVVTIGEYAFDNCQLVTSVTLPESVTCVEDYAFSSCHNLVALTITDKLTSVSAFAFPSIKTLIIAEGSREVPVQINAFRTLYKLENLFIPASVTSIPLYLFQGLGTLQGIWVDECNTVYSNDPSGVLFDKEKTKLLIAPGCLSGHYQIPDGVKTIAESAFSCENLNSITIPEGVTSIEIYAFSWCSNLTAVTVPDSVRHIGYNAFLGTAWYEAQPEGMVYAGKIAYKYKGTCPEEVILKPDTIGIAERGFSGCSDLVRIVLPGSLRDINVGAFGGCSQLTEIYIEDLGAWCDINHRENPLSANDKPKKFYVNNQLITHMEIPEGTTQITRGAFWGFNSLESVKLPSSLTSIGAESFWDCSSLTTVMIPDSVTSIEESAFTNCVRLQKVIYCGTEEQWNQIDLSYIGAFELLEAELQFHDWTDGSCTMPRICRVCGETESEASGHNWKAASCTAPRTCTVCGATEGSVLGHNWISATCTAPKTCTICGATEGSTSENGHTWEGGICTVCKQVCDHGDVTALDDGDCTTEVICPTCHMTAREANETHIPGKDDGDCTTAVKCRYCSKIATPAKNAHTPGAAATCTKPQTCTVCGHTMGKPAPHIYSDGVDGTCNVCNVHRENVEERKVVHMFRMYNPNTGEHFYTGSEVERDNLIVAGWQYEGIGFTFPANTGLPVHRLFQPSTGEHLYTMDEAEKDRLMAEGWNYEGIAFNSAYDTEAVQHRLHNPNATVGAYHFTFSEEEKQNLIAAGWEYQGIGWYSCWK